MNETEIELIFIEEMKDRKELMDFETFKKFSS